MLVIVRACTHKLKASVSIIISRPMDEKEVRNVILKHYMMQATIWPLVTILLLSSTTLSFTRAQLAPQTPSSCNSATSETQCQQDLFASINYTVDSYTERFADIFKFCVIDTTQERDAAFDFHQNLTFLTDCLTDTEGKMLDLMCSAAEISEYVSSLVNLIKSQDSEEAPQPISTVNCNLTNWSQGCEHGWARGLLNEVQSMSELYENTSTIPLRNGTAYSCCGGFFCPRALSCMIPCPLGSQCLKATLYQGICSPFNYELTPGKGYSCGGANLWADLTNSNGLFCPEGFYCPASTDIRQCNKGHFCRQGSTMETKCYPFVSCGAQASTQNIQTYGLMIIVGVAFILLIVYSCSDSVMQLREKRKMKSREKAVQQVQKHFDAVERWKSAVDAVKKFNTNLIRRPTRSFEEIQVLRSPHTLPSDAMQHRLRAINEMHAYHEDERDLKPLDLEEDLYIPVDVVSDSADGQGSVAKKRSNPRTKSQIFRYAFQEIEKEKALQKKRLGWNDMISYSGQEQSQSRRMQIEVVFKDLSLFLKGSGKKILCNVTGTLSPGRVTAVMGPSGAGKTTFLNALAGKAHGSTITGIILINGKQEPISCYRKVIGFVPQDDIVHGNLTVEENLWFSANYRLPRNMPKEEKVLVVERIIDSLGLSAIRSSKVGTVEKRGISGGQRKRVNVGIEMVMEPSLLILDEPTSGLDSTSSIFVLKALRREAFMGVNIGVVLHQPSYGLFQLFDDVMFLAKGGRTVYLGPVDDVEDYFASMGIVVPERINPPDHFMDVLEGMAKPLGDPEFDPKMLPVKWMLHNNYPIPDDLQSLVMAPDGSTKMNNEYHVSISTATLEKSFKQELWQEFSQFLEVKWDDFISTFRSKQDLSGRSTPGFFTQYKLIVLRLALQRFREARLQTQDYLILLIAGACLGFITPTKDSSLGSNNYSYLIIALSLLCMISALRTFTTDKLQYWRESSSSINRVAYFLAKDTVDHFNTVVKPVFFLSMFYFFNNPRSTFGENYIVTLALVYCVTGIAYIFAITLDPGPAQLWSVFVPIIFTLIATKTGVTGFLQALQFATYAHWALEAYVIVNAKRYSGVWLITRCAYIAAAAYDLNHWGLCLSALFIMGFVARAIAMLCLMLCNRKRQQ